LGGRTCSSSNHSTKWSDPDHIWTDGVHGQSLLASVAAKQRRARPSYSARLAVVRSIGSPSLYRATGTRLAKSWVEEKLRSVARWRNKRQSGCRVRGERGAMRNDGVSKLVPRRREEAFGVNVQLTAVSALMACLGLHTNHAVTALVQL
jgi:hypothetical protein